MQNKSVVLDYWTKLNSIPPPKFSNRVLGDDYQMFVMFNLLAVVSLVGVGLVLLQLYQFLMTLMTVIMAP